MSMSMYLYLMYLCYCVGLAGSAKYRQERAQLKYCHPIYFKDCYVFTGRHTRREPYLTNVTATTLYEFNNNLTVVIFAKLPNNDFTLSYKVCEGLKIKWIAEYLKVYSNVPPACPIVPRQYGVYNMELPPKHFPIPVPKGNVEIEVRFVSTRTKELLFSAMEFLHVQ